MIALGSEAETAAFGAWLGRHLVAGDAVLLSGPLEFANNITAIFAAVLVGGGLLAWKGQPAPQAKI